MNVASKAFLIFLPTAVLLYHALPSRNAKYNFLLLMSWLFYAWLAPAYLSVLLALTVIDYAVGRKLEATPDPRRRRLWLALSIAANLGLLAAFKYTPFLYDNALAGYRLFGGVAADRAWDILLPLGISFHTFQGISYTVDVARGEIRAVRSFRDYALFVAFFPQLSAGPIVRAAEFLPQMATPPTASARQLSDGLTLIVRGFIKKLLIADQLDALFVGPVFAAPELYAAGVHRAAALAWAVQIYCDFSGYTDIALGTAKLFGFELPANFRLPYLAVSISDFWRRWHLSFSTWLRDYLYFPLGGSRGTEWATACNLLFVFVLCGLWHGAEWKWLIYGLFNGLLMVGHRHYDRWSRSAPAWDAIRSGGPGTLVAWAVTFWTTLLGLTLIRSESWGGYRLLLGSLTGGDYAPAVGAELPAALFGGSVPAAALLLMVVGSLGHLAGAAGRLPALPTPAWPAPARAAGVAAGVAALVVLAPGVGKTFLYIQF